MGKGLRLRPCSCAPRAPPNTCVLADDLIPSVHEIRKLPQVLVYEARVRPQFVETLLTVPQGGQLAFGILTGSPSPPAYSGRG